MLSIILEFSVGRLSLSWSKNVLVDENIQIDNCMNIFMFNKRVDQLIFRYNNHLKYWISIFGNDYVWVENEYKSTILAVQYIIILWFYLRFVILSIQLKELVPNFQVKRLRQLISTTGISAIRILTLVVFHKHPLTIVKV